jgi:hypothetical protein
VIVSEKDDLRILSVDLLEALCDLDDGPWYRFWNDDLQKAKGTGKAPRGPLMSVAGFLKPYGIAPVKIRIPGTDKTGQGYRARDFEDAWARYLGPDLPPSPPKTRVQVGTSEQTHILLGLEKQNEVGTEGSCSDLKTARQPLQDNKSSDVPTSDPIPAGEGGAKPLDAVGDEDSVAGPPAWRGAPSFLSEAVKAGFHVHLRGRQVTLQGQGEDRPLRHLLRQHHAEILAQLTRPPCHACKGTAWWVTTAGGIFCQTCKPPYTSSLVAMIFDSKGMTS